MFWLVQCVQTRGLIPNADFLFEAINLQIQQKDYNGIAYKVVLFSAGNTPEEKAVEIEHWLDHSKVIGQRIEQFGKSLRPKEGTTGELVGSYGRNKFRW